MSVVEGQKQSFPAWIDAQGWAKRTKAEYLCWFRRWNPPAEVTPAHVAEFNLKYPLPPIWAMLKAYAEWSERPELNPRKRKGRRAQRLPRWLEYSEIQKLIRYCETKGRMREGLIIRILFDGGLRASELCNLKMGDFDAKRNRLRYIGKGNKEAVVSLTNQTASRLAAYIDRMVILPGDRIFPMGRCRLFTLISDAGKAALDKRISPHTLRHSLASYLLHKGVDIDKVRRYMRHTSLATTAVYLHANPKDVEKAVMDALGDEGPPPDPGETILDAKEGDDEDG